MHGPRDFAHEQVNLVPKLEANGCSEQQTVFFDQISLRMATRRDRATNVDRIQCFLRSCRSRNQPTRTNSPSPQAPFKSLLFMRADKRPVRMSRINANNRKVNASQLMPKPTRHRAGLDDNAYCMRSLRSTAVRAPISDSAFSFENHLPHLADHAYRSFPFARRPAQTYCFITRPRVDRLRELEGNGDFASADCNDVIVYKANPFHPKMNQ